MINTIVFISVGFILILVGGISYYLVKKRNSVFTSKKTLGNFVLTNIPTILFVAGFLVIILGFIQEI